MNICVVCLLFLSDVKNDFYLSIDFSRDSGHIILWKSVVMSRIVSCVLTNTNEGFNRLSLGIRKCLNMVYLFIVFMVYFEM
jgi:hypothetical protein